MLLSAYTPEVMSIYILPDELLVEIFVEACAHPFPHCRILRPEDLELQSPVALCQVSRRFRHLAQLTPELWTCIHVTSNSACSSLELAKAYISRSQSMPLSITVVHNSKFQTPKSVWDVLLTSISRWQDAAFYNIDGRDPSVASLHKALTNASLPNLGSFIFDTQAATSRDVDFTLAAPNLRKARMAAMMLSPESYSVTCKNLTQLSVSNVALESWHELVFLLWNCKDVLQSLLLGPALKFRDSEDPLQMHLSQLRSLSLTGITRHVCDEFLPNIIAPKLHELIIDAGTECVVPLATKFSTLFSSVRRLKIVANASVLTPGAEISPDYAGLLQWFPEVEQLCLDAHVTSMFMPFLCSGDPASPLTPPCPALREIVVKPATTGMPSSSSIAAFLSSRRSTDTPMRLYIPKYEDLDVSGIGHNGPHIFDFDPARWQSPWFDEDMQFVPHSA
jgi:hypothetical protein